MIVKRFLGYLLLATLGMIGVYTGGKILVSGGGDPFAWLLVSLGLAALAVGLLATARILYLTDRRHPRREKR
ncbi:MAG: hypothetical protein ACE5JP_08165 [Candidatus Bipolaricaulia bacterium]